MTDDSLPNVCNWPLRLAKFVVIVALFLGAAYGLLRWYGHYWYPYGWSHSCITILGLALTNYAELHGGCFPRGEATPEASLSLLSRKELQFAEEPESAVQILRGKSVPAEKVRECLAAGELLDPESGTALAPSVLRWFDLKSETGGGAPHMFIFKLSLGKLQSRPIEVEVSRDVVKPNSITFEMLLPE